MASDYRVGGLYHNSFDIDADGGTLYIGALDSTGTPVVLAQQSDLGSDARLAYNPGAGDEINLMCGDEHKYWIWATGNFGGDTRAVRSGDAIYWYTSNPQPYNDYWYGDAGPILIGPDNDYLITIMIRNFGYTLHEAYWMEDSLYWFDRHPTSFDVGAIDRYDQDSDQIVVGINTAVYWYDGFDIVEYSANAGKQWGDITYTLPAGLKVTSVIFQ